MSPLSNALLDAAAGGDHAAQERLLGLCQPVLSAVAARTLSRAYCWERDDALQRGRIALLQSLPRFAGRGGAAFPSYLFGVALEECVRERRLYHRGFVQPRRGFEDPAPAFPSDEEAPCDTVPPPDEAVLDRMTATRAKALLATLDPDDRRVLVLRLGLDSVPKTLAEVGALCGLTMDSVRWREQRTLRQLRKALEEE